MQDIPCIYLHLFKHCCPIIVKSFSGFGNTLVGYGPDKYFTALFGTAVESFRLFDVINIDGVVTLNAGLVKLTGAKLLVIDVIFGLVAKLFTVLLVLVVDLLSLDIDVVLV